MDAVFIASGARVKPLGRIAAMDMVDVGPTIAEHLGISMKEATGRSKAGAFRAAPARQKRPQ
jgi:hypothetical protein